MPGASQSPRSRSVGPRPSGTDNIIGKSWYKAPKGTNGASVKKPIRYETFSFHSLDDASLKRMIDRVGGSATGRHRTCVVSIISKESLNQSVREQLAQAVISSRDNPISSQPDNQAESFIGSSDGSYENQIYGQVNIDEGLVVLSLESFLDADKLLVLCNDAQSSIQVDLIRPPGYSLLMTSWPSLNQNLLKALLILFTMSHIVIFYNSEPSIDYSLIMLLKILEGQRVKSQRRIRDLLSTFASGQKFANQWIQNSRISCPRALFVYDTGKLDINIDNYREVRYDLEDQIAHLLGKTGLLQTLLTVPDHGNFVFIITKRDLDSSDINSKQQQADECKGITAQPEATDETVTQSETKVSQKKIHRPSSRLVKFIRKHISAIHSQANQQFPRVMDRESKLPAKPQPSVHVIPRFDDYFNIMLRLKCLLFPRMTMDESELSKASLDKPDWSSPDERQYINVHDSCNIDALFSIRHCQKARRAAYELYTNGLLVDLCDEQTHQELLESAKNFYTYHARGPALSSNLDILLELCNRYWLETLELAKETNLQSNPSSKKPPFPRLNKSHMQPLSVTRKPNGSVKVASNCQCGRESKLIIRPTDRRKKLERLDVYQINE